MVQYFTLLLKHKNVRYRIGIPNALYPRIFMRLFFTFILLLLFTGCSTLKVETDFDPNVMMDPSKTFHIVHKPQVDENTLLSSRIIEALKNELITQGYKNETKENADFYILFHTGVTTKSRVVTDYKYVNMYPYSYGSGFGYGYGGSGVAVVPESKNYTYKEGKLIVDAVFPKGNRIFWRGTAKDQLQSLEKPQERIDYINTVIHSLMKAFPR